MLSTTELHNASSCRLLSSSCRLSCYVCHISHTRVVCACDLCVICGIWPRWLILRDARNSECACSSRIYLYYYYNYYSILNYYYYYYCSRALMVYDAGAFRGLNAMRGLVVVVWRCSWSASCDERSKKQQQQQLAPHQFIQTSRSLRSMPHRWWWMLVPALAARCIAFVVVDLVVRILAGVRGGYYWFVFC